jgi:flagellar hook-associated protein 3 FlgL
MRVTFSATFRNLVRDTARAAEEMVKRQFEVSSGRRVRVPSDDPQAMSTIVAERAEMRATDQYVRATDSVESRLRVVDTILSDIGKMLTAAQTTAAAARNSFVTPQQREAYALELEGLRDTILGDLNTQYRGTFVFSGTASLTAPYARDSSGTVGSYAGNAQGMLVDIDRNRAVAVTVDGESLARGTDASDVFEVFDSLIAAVRAGNLTGIGQGMDGLSRAFDRVSNVQSRVGAGLSDLDDHRVRLDEASRAADTRRSALEDANLAESISAMQQAEVAYRAGLGAASRTNQLSLFDYLG